MVDFAFVFCTAVGEQLVVVLHETAVLYVSQFLGDFSGVAQVDEHEYQVFFNRVLVLAEDGVDENAYPELSMDGSDEGYQVRQQEHCANGCQRAWAFEGVGDGVEAGFRDEASCLHIHAPKEHAQGVTDADVCEVVE